MSRVEHVDMFAREHLDVFTRLPAREQSHEPLVVSELAEHAREPRAGAPGPIPGPYERQREGQPGTRAALCVCVVCVLSVL